MCLPKVKALLIVCAIQRLSFECVRRSPGYQLKLRRSKGEKSFTECAGVYITRVYASPPKVKRPPARTRCFRCRRRRHRTRNSGVVGARRLPQREVLGANDSCSPENRQRMDNGRRRRLAGSHPSCCCLCFCFPLLLLPSRDPLSRYVKNDNRLRDSSPPPAPRAVFQVLPFDFCRA